MRPLSTARTSCPTFTRMHVRSHRRTVLTFPALTGQCSHLTPLYAIWRITIFGGIIPVSYTHLLQPFICILRKQSLAGICINHHCSPCAQRPCHRYTQYTPQQAAQDFSHVHTTPLHDKTYSANLRVGFAGSVGVIRRLQFPPPAAGSPYPYSPQQSSTPC